MCRRFNSVLGHHHLACVSAVARTNVRHRIAPPCKRWCKQILGIPANCYTRETARKFDSSSAESNADSAQMGRRRWRVVRADRDRWRRCRRNSTHVPSCSIRKASAKRPLDAECVRCALSPAPIVPSLPRRSEHMIGALERRVAKEVRNPGARSRSDFLSRHCADVYAADRHLVFIQSA